MPNKTWTKFAKYVSETYGAYVDWEEEFFECPECGEPIYSCDWGKEDLLTDVGDFFCPVCESVFE